MPEQRGLFSDNFAAEVIETPVADEMSESFLAYSLSVITSRAIPDVRDALATGGNPLEHVSALIEQP